MPENMTTHGNDFLGIVTGELKKLKALGEKAIAQVGDDSHLRLRLDEESNSIDILVRHLAGNMLSRWTDFLTTDGEKPSRNRDAEFEPAPLSRADLLAAWEKGWACLLGALASLGPENLRQTVRIAGKELSVTDAILRQFAHYATHVGQIVFLAK
ncbi:MAG TPA: DUF1572 family protein, partial [Candidatus Methylomirabilis sp.]